MSAYHFSQKIWDSHFLVHVFLPNNGCGKATKSQSTSNLVLLYYDIKSWLMTVDYSMQKNRKNVSEILWFVI